MIWIFAVIALAIIALMVFAEYEWRQMEREIEQQFSDYEPKVFKSNR